MPNNLTSASPEPPAPTGASHSSAATSHTHAWGTQPEMFGPRHEYRLGMILREVNRLPPGARFLDGAVGLDGGTTGETLEHLDDDAGAAREIGRVLKPGGTCIATVPALKSLWSASDDYYEHRRRYSREELASMFR